MEKKVDKQSIDIFDKDVLEELEKYKNNLKTNELEKYILENKDKLYKVKKEITLWIANKILISKSQSEAESYYHIYKILDSKISPQWKLEISNDELEQKVDSYLLHKDIKIFEKIINQSNKELLIDRVNDIFMKKLTYWSNRKIIYDSMYNFNNLIDKKDINTQKVDNKKEKEKNKIDKKDLTIINWSKPLTEKELRIIEQLALMPKKDLLALTEWINRKQLYDNIDREIRLYSKRYPNNKDTIRRLKRLVSRIWRKLEIVQKKEYLITDIKNKNIKQNEHFDKNKEFILNEEKNNLKIDTLEKEDKRDNLNDKIDTLENKDDKLINILKRLERKWELYLWELNPLSNKYLIKINKLSENEISIFTTWQYSHVIIKFDWDYNISFIWDIRVNTDPLENSSSVVFLDKNKKQRLESYKWKKLTYENLKEIINIYIEYVFWKSEVNIYPIEKIEEQIK